jgi:hypothetical protein
MKTTILLLTVTSLCSVSSLACRPEASATKPVSPDAGAASEASSPNEAPRDLASVCAAAGPVASRTHNEPSDETPSWRRDDDAASSYGVLALGDRNYTMADLSALETQGRHAELLGHIEDVPPASRTAAWESLLVRSATALVASLDKGSESFAAFEAFMTAEHLLSRHAKLAASTEFMAQRATAGTQMFTRCFELTYSGEECVAFARDFTRVEGTDAKTLLAVAKTVRANQFPHVAVPFFHTAVKRDRSACADADLALAAEAGLALPTDYDNAKLSRELAADMCFAELEPTIVARLTGPDGGGYFTDNACAVLRAKGRVQ